MIAEQKDTRIVRFIKWALYCLLLCFTPQLITFVIGATVPCFILYLTGIEIRDYYKKKIIPRRRIAKLVREFRKRTSPFYGWKYELLVPPLYFSWDEVIKDKPLRKKNWIPEPEFHYHDAVYDEARLFDENHDVLQFGELTIGCRYETFVTLYHRGNRKWRNNDYSNLDYKEEGLLHICLHCQKQIGYDGVGLN